MRITAAANCCLDFSRIFPYFQCETGMRVNTTLDNRESIQPSIDQQTFLEVKDRIALLIDNIKSVMYVDTKKLEYIIAAKIAGGHVILADDHGVGKTSLAKALAGSIQWSKEDVTADEIQVEHFSRIQCTVDLLPQDILGFTRLDGASEHFIFNRGPIFAHFVLCDEINLLTPKTQGSFLQAMEEKMVTIEGKTYILPDPFFIIATMNLKGAHLFPLPAPQLDRFMIQLSLGYPSPLDEAEIIKKHGREDAWDHFQPVISSKELLHWQTLVDQIVIHPDIIDYVVRCVRQTRQNPDIVMGASPRTGVKISRMVRTLALIRGEDFVSIDLVKEIFMPAVSHRLVLHDSAQPSSKVIDEILRTVPVEVKK